MSRVELTRQYRRQAQRLHPDKGGCQTRFVRLTEAYRSLMRRR
jgi:DnaJ-class molecular chaperone